MHSPRGRSIFYAACVTNSNRFCFSSPIHSLIVILKWINFNCSATEKLSYSREPVRLAINQTIHVYVQCSFPFISVLLSKWWVIIIVLMNGERLLALIRARSTLETVPSRNSRHIIALLTTHVFKLIFGKNESYLNPRQSRAIPIWVAHIPRNVPLCWQFLFCITACRFSPKMKLRSQRSITHEYITRANE